jgi:ABC-type uncharacterized transport system permease subunit
MRNTITNRTVDDAVYGAVSWAVYDAVSWDVRHAVYWALKRPVEFAMPLIFADAEHPAFGDFIRSAELAGAT